MAAGSIKVLQNHGLVFQSAVDDRTSSNASYTLKPGEPVKRNTDFALLVADGDPEVATDMLLGLAINESTETSTVDGVVDVESPIPGLTVWEGKANTTSNINTAAKLLAYSYNAVTFNVSTTVITINEDETDDPNVHGLTIIGGNVIEGTLRVLVHSLATLAGTTI